MPGKGKALKVSITVSDGSRYHGASAYASILDVLFYRGVSGATVLKGIAGFGADHHLHAASLVEVSDNKRRGREGGGSLFGAQGLHGID